MPPLGVVGVATHAAAEGRETLNADAKRLADEILKTLSKKATDRKHGKETHNRLGVWRPSVRDTPSAVHPHSRAWPSSLLAIFLRFTGNLAI
jgi:hypothetical protein